MENVNIVGLDLAKHVFQAHGADQQGAVVFRKKLRRQQVLPFFATLSRCTVAMEACSSGHYWGRELAKLGHSVEAGYMSAPDHAPRQSKDSSCSGGGVHT